MHCKATESEASGICPGHVAKGAALAILLSLLISDPRTPAPVMLWAVLATLLTMGPAACKGGQWLTNESPVAFRPEDRPVSQAELAAKLVAWIGYGVAVPLAVLVTVGFFIVRRPPHEMISYLLSLVRTLGPTAGVCLALLPWAGMQLQDTQRFSDRDRGVLFITAGLLLYGCVGALKLLPPLVAPGLGMPLRLLFGALLPAMWPRHLIAIAVACGVLRCWFTCCPSGCPAKQEAAPADSPPEMES